MPDDKELLEIINSYYLDAGKYLKKAQFQRNTSPRQHFLTAKMKLEQGVQNLNTVNSESTKLRKVIVAFNLAIRSCEVGARGDYVKAKRLSMRSSAKLLEVLPDGS